MYMDCRERMPNHTRVGQGLGLSLRQWWCFLVILGLGTLVFLCHRSDADSKYDRENWVNPDDMLHYDRSTKTMRAKKPKENVNIDNRDSSFQCCEQDKELEKELREQLINCENYVKTLKPETEPEPVYREADDNNLKCKNANVKVEFQYMKRFVNILLQASKLTNVNLQEGETKQSVISVDVSSEHLSKLRRFVASDAEVSLIELDDIVSHMLHSLSHAMPSPGWFEDVPLAFGLNSLVFSRLVPYVLTLVVLTMMFVRRRSAKEILSTVVVLVFMLSYNITHDNLVKEKKMDRHATLMRHKDVPAHCLPPETYWQRVVHALRHHFTYDMGECNKIHEAMMTDHDPEIPPTVVFPAMVSDFLLHSTGKAGEAVARFSSNILGGLPFGANWVVFVLSYGMIAIIVVLVLLMLFGRGLRFWSLLGGVEFTQQPRAQASEREAVQEVHNTQLVPAAPRAMSVAPRATSAAPVSAPASPTLVSALSSTEPLVLMNMPGLVRLMSVRDETLPARDYVERLTPARGGGDLLAGGDASRVTGETGASGGKTGASGGETGASGGKTGASGGKTGASGGETGDRPDSPARDGSFEMSTHLETSEFIEEVRKILEEDLSTGKDLEGGLDVGAKADPRGGADRSSASGEPSYATKRGSSDSSDASEEFVKL